MPSAMFASSLTGVELLDVLAEKYDNDSQVSLSISTLAQSLDQKIKNPDIWDWATAIVNEKLSNPYKLIACLEQINYDVELVELIVSKGREHLIEDLQKAVRIKSQSRSNATNVMAIFYQFRLLSWNYKEITTLIKSSEESQFVQDDIKDRYEGTLCTVLISIVSESMAKSVIGYELSQDELVSIISLLKETLTLSVVKNSSSVSLLHSSSFISTYFDNLMANRSFKCNKEGLQEILNNFALTKLGYQNGLKELLISPSANKEVPKLLERVNSLKLTISDLDAIRLWAIEKEENEIAISTEAAFVQLFWESCWKEIALFVKETRQNEESVVRQLKHFKSAMEWKRYCMSYVEKLKLCGRLKEKLGNLFIDNQELIEWIQKNRTDIVGFFDDEDLNKTAFLDFIQSLPADNRWKTASYLYDCIQLVPDEKKKLSKFFEKTNDISSSKHFEDLKTTHRRASVNDFLFQHIINNLGELDKLQEAIKKKWEKVCIKADIHNVIEPIRTVRRMEINLSKYALLTSWFMSPSESIEAWKSLQEVKPDELPYELEARANQDFPALWQLESSIQDTISSLFKSNQQFSNSRNGYGHCGLKLCLSAIQSVIKYLERGYSDDESSSVQSFLFDLEIFIECRFLVDWKTDQNKADVIRNHQDQIEHWVKQLGSLPGIVSPDIKDHLSRIMILFLWTLNDSEELTGQLRSTIKTNRELFAKVFDSFNRFVRRLLVGCTKQRTVRIIKAVQHLERQQVVNLFNIRQQKEVLCEWQVPIWNESVFIKRLQVDTVNLKSFCTMLLDPKEDGMMEKRLGVVADICSSPQVNNLEDWKFVSSLVSAFGLGSSQSKIPPELLIRIQQILIDKWVCLQRQTLCDGGYLEMHSNMEVVGKFLGHPSETEAKRIVLQGLLQVKDVDWNASGESVILRYINQVCSTIEVTQDKTNILKALYSANSSLDDEEKAYVRRWIQTDCFRVKNQIEVMSKHLRSKMNLRSVAGYDILIDETIGFNYIDIVDSKTADGILKRHPFRYVHEMKEAAVCQVFKDIVAHFYSPPDAELDRLGLYNYRNNENNIKPNKMKQKHVLKLRKIIEKLLSKAKGDPELLYHYLYWLHKPVLQSLRSCPDFKLETFNESLTAGIELPIQQLLATTSIRRPNQWLDEFLINSVMNIIVAKEKMEDGGELYEALWRACFKPTGRNIVKIFLGKLAHEEPDRELLNNLISLEHVEDVKKFHGAPLNKWSRMLRRLRLEHTWTPELADGLAILDRKLGYQKTDLFLERFNQEYPLNQSDILDCMLNNLIRYPWLISKFEELVQPMPDDDIWGFLQDEVSIASEMSHALNTSLTVKEIIDIVIADPESTAVSGRLDRSSLLEQMANIKNYLDFGGMSNMSRSDIEAWSKSIREDSNRNLEVDEFLAVASRAVKLVNKYPPRDAQLLAILIFSNGFGHQSRFAQVSTGEGKTLITALLASYYVLKHYHSGHRYVDIITSSPVLAKENVANVKPLFKLLGVTVNVNCDASCQGNSKERNSRYGTHDVIYGDLSTFQHDTLIHRFIRTNLIKNRETGAVIVDEVDSMLLDKGQHVLYLSHPIAQLDELLHIFVEIWNAIHAPDMSSPQQTYEEKVEMVHRFIRHRLDSFGILVPACHRILVDRNLLTWIRNAFWAKHSAIINDHYKVGDLKDGNGQQIIIMDKQTGMEQVGMHWSGGIQQFLQLKHGLKVRSISLRAAFISNIGYMNQFRGKIYGLTGTLGSSSECNVLRDQFDVDFFKLPRFKRRFCHQEDPLLATNRTEWLANICKATKIQVNRKRAVLIICENIANTEAIYEQLTNSIKSDQISKYNSSFDQEFQERLQRTELVSGDVIVATNLAGRGTDLKVYRDAAIRGGLHVIISYLPPNKRIESQAEGRTARAGQQGSYQFVLEGQVDLNEDPVIELARLVSHRDAKDVRHVETMHSQNKMLLLEENLLARYREEIYRPIEEMLNDDCSSHDDLKKKELNDENYAELQTQFLDNRWSIWLDENHSLIYSSNLRGENKIKSKFDTFKQDCFEIARQYGLIRFASSSAELMKLARYLELVNKKGRIHLCQQCYDKVVETDPNFAAGALINKARLILEKAGYDKKLEAKGFLKAAKTLIRKQMDILTSANQVVNLTAQISKESSGTGGLFQEQIGDLLNFMQIHLMAVEDIIGRSARSAISMRFSNDVEAQEVTDLILEDSYLCTSYKLHRKLDILKDDEGNEALFIQLSNGGTKFIEWPSILALCTTPVIEFIRKKKKSYQYKVELKDFQYFGFGQDEVWTKLLQQSVIGFERISYIKRFRLSNDYHLNDLPQEISHLRKDLNEQLPGYNGQEFQSLADALFLTDEQSLALAKALKAKGILIEVEERVCRLMKTLDDIPESLKKFELLLKEWLDGVEIGEEVTRESLPCPRTVSEEGQLIWRHLLAEGAIKEPKAIFPKAADQDDVDSRSSAIEKHIKSLTGIKQLCRKHRHPDKLDAFVADIKSALLSSAGQFKTYPAVTASFRPLKEYFPEDKYPVDEMDDFKAKQFDHVIVLENYKSWWDWRAFAVAMLGVAQIVIGVAILAFSGGALATVGSAFIAEGMSDIIFAIQAGLTGTFSWSSYGTHKMWSVGITVACCGLASFLTWSAGAAKVAQMGFKGRTGLALLWAATKKVLAKCGQAALSALTSFGLDKVLDYLKKFILDKMGGFIKNALLKVLSIGRFQKLMDTMEAVWMKMKTAGQSTKDAIKWIDAKIKLSPPTRSSDWSDQLKEKSFTIAHSMANCFAESSQTLAIHGEGVKQAGKVKLQTTATGVDVVDAGMDIIAKADTIAKVTKKAQQCITVVQKGVEIQSLIAHAPGYIDQVNQQLEHEAKKHLNTTESTRTVMTDADRKEFKDYRDKIQKEMANEVVGHVLDYINRAWLKPVLQQQVEKLVKDLGKKTLEYAQNVFGDGRDRLHRERSRRQAEREATQSNGDPARSAGNGPAGQQRNDPDYPVESYDEHIDTLGQGRTSGVLDLKLLANKYGVAIEVDDPSGQFAPDSPDGKCTIKPSNKLSSNKLPTVKLSFETNADGTNHMSFVDNNGTVINVPVDSSAPPNRCVFDAFGAARGCSTNQIINEVKDHAVGDQRARDLWNEGLGNALPHLRAGAKPPPTNTPVGIPGKLTIWAGYEDYEVRIDPKPENLVDVKNDRKMKAQAKELIDPFEYDKRAGAGTVVKNDTLRIDLQGSFDRPKGSGVQWQNFQMQINKQRSRNESTSIAQVHVSTTNGTVPYDLVRKGFFESMDKTACIWINKKK